jgi:hypothetical protein
MGWRGSPRKRTMHNHGLILTLIGLLFSAINASAEQDYKLNENSTKTTPTTQAMVSPTRCIMKITRNTYCSARPRKEVVSHSKYSIQNDMDAGDAIQNIMPSFNK